MTVINQFHDFDGDNNRFHFKTNNTGMVLVFGLVDLSANITLA